MPKSARFWEIDTLRGCAVVVMIFYHFTWDLVYFHLIDIDIFGTAWQTLARAIATTFIFVMGVSLTLSYQQAKYRLATSGLFSKYLLRGLQVLGLGLLITIGTYFFIGVNGFVIFGILHLIGVSIMVSYPFLGQNKWLSLGGGLLFIAIGIYLNSQASYSPWLIPLGVKQYGRAMVDYYPIFPWSGLALLGIFAGQSLYPNGHANFKLPDIGYLPPLRALRYLGQHSLLVYMIHQPILIGLLIILGYGTL
jgi:uncharacterized membrane protein